MEAKTKKVPYPLATILLVAYIAALVLAPNIIGGAIEANGVPFNYTLTTADYVMIGGLGILTISLFLLKPSAGITIAFGILTLHSLYKLVIHLTHLLYGMPLIIIGGVFEALMLIIAYALLFGMSLSLLTCKGYRPAILGAWAAPAVLAGIGIMIGTLRNVYSNMLSAGPQYLNTYAPSILFFLAADIVLVIALGMVGRWLRVWSDCCLEPRPKAMTVAPDGTVTPGEGYISMAMHVVLLLFTGGIWQYIWIYKTTKYLNITPDAEYRNPTTKLLLCMFVPFYYFYWVYQSAKRIDALGRTKGDNSDITTVSLILAFFIGIVPPILMQSKINQICTKPDAPAAAPAAAPEAAPAASSAADELKKYKELLDSGAITEEEYEAKKKQLLGL